MNYLTISVRFILKQVARVKSTARPMTSKELAASGVSTTRIEIRESENIQSRVELPMLFPILGVRKKGK
jgi:hypothetical protein